MAPSKQRKMTSHTQRKCVEGHKRSRQPQKRDDEEEERRVVLCQSCLPHPPRSLVLCWGFKSLSGQGCHLLHHRPPATTDHLSFHPHLPPDSNPATSPPPYTCQCPPSCIIFQLPLALQLQRISDWRNLEHLLRLLRSLRLSSVWLLEFPLRAERKDGMRKTWQRVTGMTWLKF